MTVCHIDIETFSECDLKSAGVYRYAEHPSTELTVLGYAFDDGPVKQWKPGDDYPEDLYARIEAGGEIRAHNAAFERVVLNGTAGQRIGFPFIRIDQTVCTAAKCAANGLPRALGDAAKALGTHAKSEAGRIEMLQIAKPRKGKETRYTPENSPDKFAAMYAYNLDDVEAERALDHAVPDLTEAEQDVYELDQLINSRGISVDLPAIDDILAVVEEYKGYLAVECEELTRDWLTGEGLKPTQRDKLAEWVRANGYPLLPDMQAETVKAIIRRDEAPDTVKRLLRIYSTYNAKAITKFHAILEAVCSDGKLRGMFLFHGANTGRWSSLIVQLQNLFKPVIDDPEAAVEAFGSRSLDLIRLLYDEDPIKVAASCVRSVLVASPGKDLLFPDYAGIESRVNAWLFDEQWKLDAFRAYDAGNGPDLYLIAVADALGLDVRAMTKKDKRRQWGKAIDLFGGYEGGVNAFVVMADTYSVPLQDVADAIMPVASARELDTAEWMWEKFGSSGELDHDIFVACDVVKQRWRAKHPYIVQGWKHLKEACEQAVQHPGTGYAIPNGKIAFKVIAFNGRNWLYMRLPSGRRLAFYNPRWIPEKTVIETDEFGREVERIIPGELRYWGIDTYTRQFKEVSTYGGKLCENAVQAISRDLLVEGMWNLENGGYPILGSVHDEVITEPDEDFGSFEEAGELMCILPTWAAGLPVAVDGHRGKRYRK